MGQRPNVPKIPAISTARRRSQLLLVLEHQTDAEVWAPARLGMHRRRWRRQKLWLRGGEVVRGRTIEGQEGQIGRRRGRDLEGGEIGGGRFRSYRRMREAASLAGDRRCWWDGELGIGGSSRKPCSYWIYQGDGGWGNLGRANNT